MSAFVSVKRTLVFGAVLGQPLSQRRPFGHEPELEPVVQERHGGQHQQHGHQHLLILAQRRRQQEHNHRGQEGGWQHQHEHLHEAPHHEPAFPGDHPNQIFENSHNTSVTFARP